MKKDTTKFTAKEIDSLWFEFNKSYCALNKNNCRARTQHRRVECIRGKCFIDFLQKRGRIVKMPNTHNPDEDGNCGNCGGGFCVGCGRKPHVKIRPCRECGKMPQVKRDAHLFTISCCGSFAFDTDGRLAVLKWNNSFGKRG